MKICWDNLEGVRLTKNGTFRKNTSVYIEREACKVCGQAYLAQMSNKGSFCSSSCADIGKNKARAGKGMYGSLNNCYRGGVCKSGLTVYNTYKDRIDLYEDIRKQNGTELLEAKCVYCGKWFTPMCVSVNNRIAAINSLNRGEARLYCSVNCKLACPTYGMHKYPKGFKHTSSREVLPALRKMVLERDNWTCQICGKTSKEAQLHVHHMDPVAQNPMFQNDMNSCITLCKCCHTFVHKQRGCRYIDLRCNRETDYTKEFKEGIRLKSINSQE